MSYQYQNNNLQKNRKLSGNSSFIRQSAECGTDKQRKHRNDDPCHKGKDDFLEFIQYTGDQLCLIPCSSQTYHDRKYQSTHNGHDLRDLQLKDHFRQLFQASCIGMNRKMRDNKKSGCSGKKCCADRRTICQNNSNSKHNGSIFSKLCD